MSDSKPLKHQKYKMKKRIQGRLDLADERLEQAVHMYVHGSTREDIFRMVPELTPEEWEQALLDPLVQKRIAYKKTMKLRKEKPLTPGDQIEYALGEMRKLYRSCELPKDKIQALKGLAIIAGALIKAPPVEEVVEEGDDPKVAELKRLYEKGE